MKKRMKRLPALLASFLLAMPVMAADPGTALYGNLLARHVRDGRVDYAGLKAAEGGLDAALDALARVDPASLSAKDQFAYYINPNLSDLPV